MTTPIVSLTVSVNGGPPQQGGVTCAVGNTIQLSATNKAGWGNEAGLAPTRWEIIVVHTGFATPSGWTSNGDGSFYCLGNDDPPPFTVSPWGKYAPRVVVGGTMVDQSTMISAPHAGTGATSVGFQEGAQFGGLLRRWLYSLDFSIRSIVDAAGFNPNAVSISLGTTGTTDSIAIGNSGASTTVDADALTCTVANDLNIDAGGFSLVAPAVDVICDSMAIAGTAGGVAISSAVTPATPAAGTIKLKADTAISFTTAAATVVCSSWGITNSGGSSQTCTTYGVTASGAWTVSGTTWTGLYTGACLLNGSRLATVHHARGASTANVASLTGALTHDGVTYATGEIFLAKDQSTASQNGPYVINTAGAWTRPAWYDSTADALVNLLVLIAEGSTNAGRGYRLATTGAITVGTTSTTWSQFGGASTSLDPVGTLELAKATSSAVTVGAVSPSHTPSFTMFCTDINVDCNNFVVTGSGGDIQFSTSGGDATLSGDNATVSATVTATLAGSASTVALGANCTTTTTGTVTTQAGSAQSITSALGSAASKQVLDVSGTSLRCRDYGTANTLGWTHVANATAVADTAVGTYDLTAGGAIGLTNTSGSMTLTSFARLNLFAQNDQIDIRSGGTQPETHYPGSRTIDIRDVGTGRLFIQLLGPSPVTPGSSAATTIGTITVDANSCGRFVGTVSVRNGATNSKSMDITLDWNADGTTVTSRNLTVTATTVQGTIGTVAGDVAKSDAGLVITITVANASGFRCAVRGRADTN